ncbi:hypothetical protein BW80_12255 [Escherichia coli O111:NM str. 03-3484]|nr:hypothetical protein ECO9574_20450 [Escherichia coli O111:H8 str. CVM9574]EIL27525.1 hypothetical protein ECO9570_17086 [Escherichia coli O111:H8 str. CVM9570]EJE59877.1 hypothetical protein ECO9602_26067 [Escherichia coli O111:H8 str. CVM9602]EJE75516.1 hypothetical protein ECO9634_13063 [Escherichia coli O111:H8 str. CVM9634]EKU04314.1 hypothetical protein CFSAN001632_01219 [Escherichia coli O111:H8 str. CFSAN001632]ETD62992.1 hypothetical protein Q458_15615 [Escherichia coli ATCC BAA-220
MLKIDAIAFLAAKQSLPMSQELGWQALLHGGNWFLKVARCACKRHPAGNFSTTPKFMTNIVRQSGRGG